MGRIFEKIKAISRIPVSVPAVLGPICILGIFRVDQNSLLYLFICAGAFFVWIYSVLNVGRLVALCHRFVKKNPFFLRFQADEWFCIRMILTASGMGNGIYVLYQLVLAMYYHTVWYYGMCGYYFLLAVMRGLLLRHSMRFPPGQRMGSELRLTGLCGIGFLLMNVVLTIIVQYVLRQGRIFYHPMWITIAMAAYTFTAFGLAVRNFVRYRKSKSPVIAMTRRISMATACVSMLTLEMAMLSSFGRDKDIVFDHHMLAGTGIVVAVALFTMSISTIMTTIRGLHSIPVKQEDKI